MTPHQMILFVGPSNVCFDRCKKSPNCPGKRLRFATAAHTMACLHKVSQKWKAITTTRKRFPLRSSSNSIHRLLTASVSNLWTYVWYNLYAVTNNCCPSKLLASDCRATAAAWMPQRSLHTWKPTYNRALLTHPSCTAPPPESLSGGMC